jgi:hypothetical protein
MLAIQMSKEKFALIKRLRYRMYIFKVLSLMEKNLIKALKVDGNEK